MFSRGVDTPSAMLAQEFAGKAKVNAQFALAAVRGLGREALSGAGMVPTLGLQPANQLVVEGLELALKTFLLARGATPPAHHALARLYELLDSADRAHVDETVRSAVEESASGSVPLGRDDVAHRGVRVLDLGGGEFVAVRRVLWKKGHGKGASAPRRGAVQVEGTKASAAQVRAARARRWRASRVPAVRTWHWRAISATPPPVQSLVLARHAGGVNPRRKEHSQ